MTMDKIEHRAVIKFFVKKGLKAMEIYTDMLNVLGESTPSKTMVCKWAGLFKNGRISIEDDPREGRPKTASTTEIIEKVHSIISEFPNVTTRKIADTIGISDERVRHILHEELHMYNKNINMPRTKISMKAQSIVNNLYVEEKNCFIANEASMENLEKNCAEEVPVTLSEPASKRIKSENEYPAEGDIPKITKQETKNTAEEKPTKRKVQREELVSNDKYDNDIIEEPKAKLECDDK